MNNPFLTVQIQRFILCSVFLLCAFIFPLSAADWRTDLKSGTFTSESHTGNDTIIKKNGDAVENIQNGSWVSYAGFDFDTGVTYCWIEAATAGVGGTIQVRTGAANGPVAGTIAVRSTGNISTFKPFPLKLSTPITGVKDLFLTFTGGTGNLFNVKRIHFQRFAPDYQSPNGYTDWEMPVTERGLFQAISFDVKGPTGIATNGDKLTSIQNGSWVGYKNFDFGVTPGMNFFWVQASTSGTGGKIEVRLGSDAGELVGTITVTGTGGSYKPFLGNLTRNVSGKNDLYLKFTGGTGTLFSLDTFRFAAGVPNTPKSMQRTLAASSFNAESAPSASPVVANGEIITDLINNSWTRYDGIDFGSATDLLSIEAATPNKGGTLEVRSGTIDGPLVGKINVSYTGSWTLYRPYTTMLLSPLSGVQTVFFKFTDSFGQTGNLFNVKNFTFGKKMPKAIGSSGQLSVYPPVPGLAPSPYYTFSVQKLSALTTKKEDATNWLTPFAWFTNCPEKGTPDTPAYYKDYIGGWSQTYCNFEMDKNTPIVVKITRKTTIADGAPAGPIFMANAHPAHRVMSCEIINGDVYVTMSQPAQVAIDIDGQMDTRDLPRSSPSSFVYPGASKATGCHSVTIFANPFINKPSLSDPSVLVVEPNTALPDLSGSWKTLYFKPGVHDLSMLSKLEGAPGNWKGTDVLKLVDGKNYYIPGDAIVYGLMNDWGDGKTNSDIRVYGHGTLNGSRVPHYYFYQGPPWNGNYSDQPMKILSIQDANNCHYEGITVADPPVFGPRIEGSPNIKQNSMKWIKIITWRTNNDGHWVSDGITEDSFIRHQDDGMYIRNHAVRRCVFWTDVNGSPCRSSFLTRDNVPETPSFRPRDSVFEDTDFIYLRAVFTSANPSDPKDDPNSSIMGELGGNSAYSDKTWNTGQHTVFNNVRATDPRPFRSFFGFDATGETASFKGLAGLRFYNVEYRFPQTFGWKEHMIGIPTGPMQYFYFDRFSFNGDKFNAAYLANPARFTSATKDMVFLDSLAGSPTTSLVVSLTKPVSFSSYTLPAAVPLAVSVSNPSAVSHVQFYIDDSLVATDSAAPYTYSASGLAVGLHQFHARIVDKSGLAYLTKVITANVKPSGSTSTPPTIKTPASGPGEVTGTTAKLSVMGDSPAGEGSLTYTWDTTGTPPAGVTFSENGNNVAKETVVTFSKAGDYTLDVTLVDGSGESVISGPVTIKVIATLTDIAVSSPSPAIVTGASVTLTAQARDQFGDAMPAQPTFAWTIDAGVGTVIAGVYTAPASGTGKATIKATTTSGPLMSGTTVVSFSPSTVSPPTIATPASATPTTVTGTTATLSAVGASAAGEASLTYTWATTGTPPAGVTFSVNGTNAAKTTVVTFSKIGIYTLQVTIRDGSGQTVTSNVTVTVTATLTGIAVSPSSSAILTSATVALTAQANDQFGAAMATQPTFAWSIEAGVGTVSTAGVYTAPASGTSNATIRATTTSGPVMSGTAAVSYSPSGSTAPDPSGGGSGGGCGLGSSFAGLLLGLFLLLKFRLRLVDRVK
jgi:Carbohydrate binding module (family 6)/Bacterial Ig domain